MADGLAETSPVGAEHARLPRWWNVVMGCAAVASIAGLVAVVIPDAATIAPSTPSHAPELERSPLPDGKPHFTVKRDKHKAPREAPVVDPPSSSWHEPSNPAPRDEGDGVTVESHQSEFSSNVQDATSNANESSHVTVNRVEVTSSSKHVSNSGSVHVENNGVQVTKSGAATNSVHVSSSVNVSHSHKYSNRSPRNG